MTLQIEFDNYGYMVYELILNKIYNPKKKNYLSYYDFSKFKYSNYAIPGDY